MHPYVVGVDAIGKVLVGKGVDVRHCCSDSSYVGLYCCYWLRSLCALLLLMLCCCCCDSKSSSRAIFELSAVGFEVMFFVALDVAGSAGSRFLLMPSPSLKQHKSSQAHFCILISSRWIFGGLLAACMSCAAARIRMMAAAWIFAAGILT